MNRMDIVQPLLVLLAAAPLCAHDLGGGSRGANGLIPRARIDHWIPGRSAAITFLDVDAGALGMGLILSPARTDIPLPGLGGARLRADPLAPGALVMGGFTPGRPSRSIGSIPLWISGTTLYIQGIVADPGAAGGVALTSATRIDFFAPWGAVGNSRQSSNSVDLFDTATNQIVSTVTNSENGYITFGPRRQYMYVPEPGSQRDRVEVYDLRQAGAPKVASIPTSAGIRYGCAIPRDGLTMYVPTAMGISVVDLDPASATYRSEVGFLPATFTGSTGSIFTGPLDVAVTPDGAGLFVAYGESGVWPGTGNVGFFDLTQPSPTEQLIPVTNGGTFFSLATRQSIDVSEDGRFVYALEFGVPAGFPFSSGFANGSSVNVIDVQARAEVAVIPTGIVAQNELAVDRLNEWLYVPGLDPASSQGRVVGIDVRAGSPSRMSVQRTYHLGGSSPFASGGGPAGVDATPDGSTLYVSVVEDSSHLLPLVEILDAATGAPSASPLQAGSLCHTVSVQQR